MRTELEMMIPPIGMQPGGYIKHAYVDRTAPPTPTATLEVTATRGGHRVQIEWACPDPVSETRGETDLFSDAAAIFAPVVPSAPWITMGMEGAPVEGALWRADREALMHVRAEGLGSMTRTAAPEGWSATGTHSDGRWRVVFTLVDFAPLAEQKMLAVGIWRGATRDRGGLKSVSPGWIPVVT